METKKIAVACFIGGVLCYAVALMCAPKFLWFALIAGMAGGYISYEFREVRKAVPIALRAAGKGSLNWWNGRITKARVWLSKSHPFFYPGALLAFLVWVILLGSGWMNIIALWREQTIGMSAFLAEIYFVSAMVSTALFGFFALIGARFSEQCFWETTIAGSEDNQQEWLAKMSNKGYHHVPATYTDVMRWSAKGLGLTLKFLAWSLWKELAVDAWKALCFLGLFAWYLFKLIHSKKRVLCAIDGTLGGAMSYIWLAQSSTSFVQQALLVIFGGLLGAAFGVFNYEIISKKILKVVPVE